MHLEPEAVDEPAIYVLAAYSCPNILWDQTVPAKHRATMPLRRTLLYLATVFLLFGRFPFPQGKEYLVLDIILDAALCLLVAAQLWETARRGETNHPIAHAKVSDCVAY